MKTFQEWANEGNSDLFEMAQIITPEGQKGRWGLKAVQLEGPGVVNVLKKLGGEAGIHDLATELVKSSTIRLKGEEGAFVSLAQFAKDQGEPEDKFLSYIVKLQKDQLRKQKGKGGTWKARIAVINNKWTLQAGAEAPKKTGGAAKDTYQPKAFMKKDEPAEEETEEKPAGKKAKAKAKK